MREVVRRRLVLHWLVLPGVLMLGGCEEQVEPPLLTGTPTEDADQVMYGIVHYVTGNGIVRGKLESDTAFMYEDSAIVRVRPVNLTLYDDEGAIAGEVTARSGVLNTRTRVMVATGDVIVEETAGDRIETEELHFDPNRDRVWSVVATTIHRQGTVLRGTGFTSNTQLTDTRLDAPTGQVQGLEF